MHKAECVRQINPVGKLIRMVRIRKSVNILLLISLVSYDPRCVKLQVLLSLELSNPDHCSQENCRSPHLCLNCLVRVQGRHLWSTLKWWAVKAFQLCTILGLTEAKSQLCLHCVCVHPFLNFICYWNPKFDTMLH